jgi:hypothetical protein
MLDQLQSEKRTDRLDVPKQLRLGTTLGQLIRRLAERGGRSIQQQMVLLITKGIEQHCRETGNALGDLLHESASDFVRPGPIRSENVREKGESAA